MCYFEMVLIMIGTIFVASEFIYGYSGLISFGRRQKLDKPLKTGITFNTVKSQWKIMCFFLQEKNLLCQSCSVLKKSHFFSVLEIGKELQYISNKCTV